MRAAAAIAIWSVAAWAQPRAAVTELVELVRSSIAEKRPDDQMAKALRKLHLGEQLDDHTIEELESEGAGPKTVAEMVAMRDESRAYPQPVSTPKFAHGVPPGANEQVDIIEQAREVALSYAKSLPDFLCSQVVRRYRENRGKWDLKDTLEMRLSYFDQHERYQLLAINGHRAVGGYDEIGGTISEGEFGSLLLQVFERQVAADFRWDHWTTLRKRPAHVFRFKVSDKNSLYHMEYRSPYTGRHNVVAGQHGFVYIDAETNRIVRIYAEADSIPPGFPVDQSTTMLDYDFTDVGGRQFLLPLHADVRLQTPDFYTKNEVEFRGYRKFTTDSTITYGREK